MALTPVNPIVSVDGAAIPCPSSFVWTLEDISASDAGRTEDGVMHKKRLGQVRKVTLEWWNIETSVASVILTAFNPEYIDVEYLDPMEGGFRTSNFYVGNRSTPMYNASMGLWQNVSFSIIERG